MDMPVKRELTLVILSGAPQARSRDVYKRQAVLSPVVASIIASNGWRMGYIVLGVLALVIVIPAVLIWFRTPEQKGQLPLGATEADIEAAKHADPKAEMCIRDSSGGASMIGMGSASVLSRAIGAKDQRTIDQVMGNLVVMNLVLSLTVTIVGTVFARPLLALTGAQGQVLDLAESYLRIMLVGKMCIRDRFWTCRASKAGRWSFRSVGSTSMTSWAG